MADSYCTTEANTNFKAVFLMLKVNLKKLLQQTYEYMVKQRDIQASTLPSQWKMIFRHKRCSQKRKRIQSSLRHYSPTRQKCLFLWFADIGKRILEFLAFSSFSVNNCSCFSMVQYKGSYQNHFCAFSIQVKYSIASSWKELLFHSVFKKFTSLLIKAAWISLTQVNFLTTTTLNFSSFPHFLLFSQVIFR